MLSCYRTKVNGYNREYFILDYKLIKNDYTYMGGENHVRYDR